MGLFIFNKIDLCIFLFFMDGMFFIYSGIFGFIFRYKDVF